MISLSQNLHTAINDLSKQSNGFIYLEINHVLSHADSKSSLNNTYTFNYSTPEPTIKHLSLPNSLLQFQVYLRSVYNRGNYSKHSKPSEFLAVNRPERSLNLVLVREERQIDTSHNQQHNFAFHGKVDEIQKQKTPIKIEKNWIYFKNQKWLHTLSSLKEQHVLENLPCSGSYACRLWSEGKLQHEWELMVLVEIRDENTRKATSVYDLLFHPDDSIRQSITQEVQKREGEGLMIIFDGYDELSDDQRSEFSLVQKFSQIEFFIKPPLLLQANKLLQKVFQLNLDRPWTNML